MHPRLLIWTLLGVAACGGDPNGAPASVQEEARWVPHTKLGSGEDLPVRPIDPGTTMPDPDPDPEPELDPDPDPTGPLAIITVQPAFGDPSGDTTILLELNRPVDGEPSVYFGAHRARSVRALNTRYVLVQTPPSEPGRVDVKIQTREETALLAGAFRYSDPPSIATVEPRVVQDTGGEVVTIRGNQIGGGSVSFGGTGAIAAETLNADTLVATVPPHLAGLADIRVTLGEQVATLEDGLEYVPALRIDGVFPRAGLPSGGTSVQITGLGLHTVSRVTFAGFPAEIVRIHRNQLQVIAPPGPDGEWGDIEVVGAHGVEGVPRGWRWSDDLGLVVAAVAPAVGGEDGGHTVDVIGAGFDRAATVTFGTNDAQVRSDDPRTLRVLSPPGRGLVDVSVTVRGVTSTLEEAYRYEETLALHAVTPRTADAAGGVEVQVSGRGFTRETVFRFGPMVATAVSVSNLSATVVLPPGSVGTSDVSVEQTGQRAVRRDFFTYTSELSVASVIPAAGSMAGGAWIQIRGGGFWGEPTVSLGGAPCTNATVVDPSTIRCKTSRRNPESVDATVTLNQEETRLRGAFVYFNPTTRFGGVWGAPIRDTINVSVVDLIGTAPVQGAFVMLGHDPLTNHQGWTDENGLITFSGRGVTGFQTVSAVGPAGTGQASIQSIGVQNVTLNIIVPPPPSTGNGPAGDPQRAYIHGWLYPPPKSQNERFRGIIQVSRTADGDITEVEVVITNNEPVRFGIPSDVGDIAVGAWLWAENQEEEGWDPVGFAIQRGLVLNDGDDAEVVLVPDIPLETISFKVQGWDGEARVQVTPTVNLGFEGSLRLPEQAQGEIPWLTTELAPKFEGPLLTATLDVQVLAGSVGTHRTSHVAMTGLTPGNSDNQVDLSRLMGIPNVITPRDGETIRNRHIELETSNGEAPDFWHVWIRSPSRLEIWWIITVPGWQPYIQLPEFPDFSWLPPAVRPEPYPGGQGLFLDVRAVRAVDFDYDSYEMIPEVWQSGTWESYGHRLQNARWPQVR
jgi:hypothetical protein